MPPTKLYVGNLPYRAEKAQLEALFGADGRKVASVLIVEDPETGRSRGFAFVEMATAKDAQAAIAALNGREFLGRAMTVTESRPSERKESPDGDAVFEDRTGRIHRPKRG
jgi:cold-inducible RNA-binding protein